ncbi:unnamed protein product [Effrenium voratum]|nr:unnamed protein product [Effrenium voratum]CAJ1460909.1 unnamed protein product [Effrenium voratum]
MQSWQFKTDLSEDEANWESQTLSDWLLLGHTALRRCSQTVVAEKFYLTTSPCGIQVAGDERGRQWRHPEAPQQDRQGDLHDDRAGAEDEHEAVLPGDQCGHPCLRSRPCHHRLDSAGAHSE